MSVVDVKRLRAAMQARGLTAEQLARLVSYQPKTVADYVANRRQIPEAFAILVETALRLRVGALRPGVKFERPDEDPEPSSWIPGR